MATEGQLNLVNIQMGPLPNFVRIHQALKVTPAMAANVSDRLWEVRDIVTLVEAYLAEKIAEKKAAARLRNEQSYSQIGGCVRREGREVLSPLECLIASVRYRYPISSRAFFCVPATCVPLQKLIFANTL
jgi:hypothetical protein